MELDELHVDQVGAGVVGQGVAVTGVLPTVAGDLESAADAAGGQHDRLRPVDPEPAALAVVGKGAGDPAVVEQQPEDRVLHVEVDAPVDAVILQRPDHLEPCAVADVGEARVAVAPEVPLQDAAILRAVEQGPPGLKLQRPLRRLLGVDLGHLRVAQVLAAPQRVRDVDLPVVALVHVADSGRHSALGHHRMRLAEQGLADHAAGGARGRGFDRGAQAGAARADHQHVVLVGCLLHQRILKSVQTPIEHNRT